MTIQIIKVSAANDENIFGKNVFKRHIQIKNPKLLLLFLLAAFFLTAGFIFKDEIFKVFSATAVSVNDSPVKTIINAKPDLTSSMLQKANAYLQSGNLDSSLALYNLVLQKNPANTKAAAGKKINPGKNIRKRKQTLGNW